MDIPEWTCKLDRAAYIDRGTGTKFCEHCYQRAARLVPALLDPDVEVMGVAVP